MLIPIRFEREGGPVGVSLAASFQAELDRLELHEIFRDSELARIESFKFPTRRESFLLGRLAAKRAALALGPWKEARDFEIRQGIFGQPLFDPNAWELSIAHSSGAAMGVACDVGHPVGIDLERADRGKIDALESSFTEAERKHLAGLPGLLEENFGLGWSLKEALSKALRCGLMTPFTILEFSRPRIDRDGSVEVEFAHFGQFKARAWRVGGFTMALALPRKTAVAVEFPKELLGRLAAR